MESNSTPGRVGPVIIFKDGYLRILLEKNTYEIDLTTEEVRAFVKERMAPESETKRKGRNS